MPPIQQWFFVTQNLVEAGHLEGFLSMVLMTRHPFACPLGAHGQTSFKTERANVAGSFCTGQDVDDCIDITLQGLAVADCKM
jgi:hypothetical protein